MKQRNIQISDEENEFLKDNKKSFNFSKFVRAQLLEYMNFKRGLQE